MPYSYQGGEKRIAKAFGKEQDISPKKANEVCYTIKGMNVQKAIDYLASVAKKKDFVPFRRYHKKVAHRTGGVIGRYPVKAAKVVSGVVQNARMNAEYKGMDPDKLKIIHATAYKGIELDRVKPKGRGRSHNIVLTNIEIVVKEV